IDYHRAKARADRDLARLVYFGTPHKSFRRKLVADFPCLEHENEFVWTSGATPDARGISVRDGLSEPPLRRGQLGHRLLLALSADFYRPSKVAELFGRLFPGEVF